MRWYNKMYLGKSIQGKKMYYQYAIQHTKRLTGTYCLMPAACKDDLIDICGSDLLRVSKQYPKDQLVIGLAGSYREAVSYTHLTDKGCSRSGFSSCHCFRWCRYNGAFL